VAPLPENIENRSTQPKSHFIFSSLGYYSVHIHSGSAEKRGKEKESARRVMECSILIHTQPRRRMSIKVWLCAGEEEEEEKRMDGRLF